MKEKFESLKKLNTGSVLSQNQQKNVLGGYSGDMFVECFQAYTYLGWIPKPAGWSGNGLQACQAVWPQTTRATVNVEP